MKAEASRSLLRSRQGGNRGVTGLLFLHCPILWLFDLLCHFLSVGLSGFFIATPASLHATLSLSKSLDLLDKCIYKSRSDWVEPDQWRAFLRLRVAIFLRKPHVSQRSICAKTALGKNAFKVTYWRMKRLLAHFSDPEILLSCVWLYEITAQQWTVWVDELLSELL